jgi:two-component system, chemotaxis family, protein-glutamate methylesterase/glutaminase
MPGRDIIVAGASAGGVEALSNLVAGFDADLPAAVFVVLHVSPQGTSVMPAILSRAGPLPASHAVDGELIEHGRIYVAPPDFHLLLRRDRIYLRRGPRENGCRPAVDPLFRTAAHAFGRRVIGVVLSGALDDGTFGLLTVKQHGGYAIVQDPAEALHPSMPDSARTSVDVDEVLRVAEIGPRISMLVRDQVEENAVPTNGGDPTSADGEVDMGDADGADGEGTPAGISCPHCGGSLWEVEEEGLVRYRCRIGHRYAPAALLSAQSDSLEASLWTAVRALEEMSATARRIATRIGPNARSSGIHLERAIRAEQHADVIRRLLLVIENPVASN